jgi:hypothetical protein
MTASGRRYTRAFPGLELALECQWCGAADAVVRDDPLACLSAASARGWKPMAGDRLQAKCGPCARGETQIRLWDERAT